MEFLKRGLRLQGDATVFFCSAGLIFAFVAFGTFFTELALQWFGTAQDVLSRSLGWFYHASVTFCLLFCIWLCVSRYGRCRLGGHEERPKYSYVTWFSMLFSAGMGIGILFWSVAEPLTHFGSPPYATETDTQAARLAMDITLLHWGLHGWCVYVVVGLGLACAAYCRGQPLTFRSALHPILGSRVDGRLGHMIDIFAILGTMFGVATSLGLGAQQINAGLNFLFGVEISIFVQLLLIAGITALATVSVVSGLDRGICWLSRVAIWLALALLVFIFFAGPTTVALRSVFEYTGHYLWTIGRQGGWSHLGGSSSWQGDWTLFYWGWWIAWSPFVGTFVARISRGRTVREFILGVLLVPTIVSAIWFCIFGGIAMEQVTGGETSLLTSAQEHFEVTIFVLFDSFPATRLLSLIGLVIIVVFFVTSSDSASLVIDYMASGGDPDPPKRQRVFWATTEGVVAAVLLLGGGIGPMRAFQLLTGLPLAVILLLICWSIVKALRQELKALPHR